MFHKQICWGSFAAQWITCMNILISDKTPTDFNSGLTRAVVWSRFKPSYYTSPIQMPQI